MNPNQHPFPSKDIDLPNGHKGHTFVLVPEWAWDLVDLCWVKLVQDSPKPLHSWVNR